MYFKCAEAMSFANKRGRGRGYDGRGSDGRGGDGRGGGNQSYSATRRTEINRNQRAPIILAKPQHHDHRSGRDPVDVDYSDRPPNRVSCYCIEQIYLLRFSIAFVMKHN